MADPGHPEPRSFEDDFNEDPSLLDGDDEDDALFRELERDDDNDIAAIREQRMEQIRREVAELERMRHAEHGAYTEMDKEKEVMDLTLKTRLVVLHFFHSEFRRCAIMDKHLQEMASRHFETKFIKINVEKAPFLVDRLKVQVLPCVLSFVDGANVDRVVGFEDLGNTDSFTTAALELRLASTGVIEKRETTFQQIDKRSISQSNDDDDEDED